MNNLRMQAKLKEAVSLKDILEVYEEEYDIEQPLGKIKKTMIIAKMGSVINFLQLKPK